MMTWPVDGTDEGSATERTEGESESGPSMQRHT